MPSSAAQLSMHHSSNSVKDDALVRRFTLAVVYVGTMQPARHSRRAAGAASLSMFLKTALTLTAVLAACQVGAATTNCKAGKCITIGSDKYCSGCALDTEAPINGACAVPSNQDVCVRVAGGRCVECATAAFMYKGGCYATANAPGKTMCKTAANGKCDTPADGYFVPPSDTDASHDSVVSCGDTAGVTLGSDGSTKTYKGVDGCETCTAPKTINGGTGAQTAAATCTKCGNSKIVKTDENGTTCIAEADCPTTNGYFLESGSPKNCKACAANCLTCTSATETACQSCTANTYFLGAENGQTGKCVSCGDAVTGSGDWKGVTGCAKCTKPNTAGAATCTECQADKYLKTVESTTSCETNCGEGFFATTVDSIKKCVFCSDKNNGVDGCEKCTAPAQGKTKPTCTKCSGDKYLKTVDGATTCVAKDTCKDDYFPKEGNTNENKCLSCSDETDGVPNCAKCALSSRATKPTCSECISGYKLEGETCVSTGGVNLSPGAIAGISVAAVVVVGGLVGFLCWWFLCRGKA